MYVRFYFNRKLLPFQHMKEREISTNSCTSASASAIELWIEKTYWYLLCNSCPDRIFRWKPITRKFNKGKSWKCFVCSKKCWSGKSSRHSTIKVTKLKVIFSFSTSILCELNVSLYHLYKIGRYPSNGFDEFGNWRIYTNLWIVLVL